MSTTDTTWRDALLLDAPRIAGLKVRPLSAWHCHVAQLLEVCISCNGEGRGPTPGDVAHAIAICRSEFRANHAGLPVAGWFLRRVYLPVRWIFRDWRKDALDLVRYVESYRHYPEIKRQQGKEGQPIGCPQFFAVAVDVTMQIPSVTLVEALNMSLVSLYCLRAAAVEMAGGPACAWRSPVDQDEVQAAFAVAKAAITRHEAAMQGGIHGQS